MGLSILIFVALMGVPWGPTPPFGNFSGEVVYASEQGHFDLEGTYNLYGCRKAPDSIQLKLILGDTVKVLEVDRTTGTFNGNINLGREYDDCLEARLVVDGRIIATSVIPLHGGPRPSVKIIRFTSQWSPT